LLTATAITHEYARTHGHDERKNKREILGRYKHRGCAYLDLDNFETENKVVYSLVDTVQNPEWQNMSQRKGELEVVALETEER